MARRSLQWEQRKSAVRSLSGRGTTTLIHPRSLPQYPRNRLKLYLSDGFQELEALEYEGHRLPGVILGRTPMGTKVCLKNSK